MQLTDQVIDEGKARLKRPDAHHEHNDCVRIAYEWLDAQAKTKGYTRQCNPLKHMIEQWAGRYVSQDDVEVAAMLHPDVKGKYPFFNIGARLTKPSERRLENIGQAFTQDQRTRFDPIKYKIHEA